MVDVNKIDEELSIVINDGGDINASSDIDDDESCHPSPSDIILDTLKQLKMMEEIEKKHPDLKWSLPPRYIKED